MLPPQAYAWSPAQELYTAAPDWATKALQPFGVMPLMPPPTLPPLQELFEQNMRDQAEERSLRQMQQLRKQRSNATSGLESGSEVAMNARSREPPMQAWGDDQLLASAEALSGPPSVPPLVHL